MHAPWFHIDARADSVVIIRTPMLTKTVTTVLVNV